MTSILILLLSFVLVNYVTFVCSEEIVQNFQELTKELHHIQKMISHNHSIMKTYGHDPDNPGQNLFRDDTFASISNLPILYWQIDLPGHTLGNHLGTYFDSMACAYKNGLHFVGLSPRTDSNDPFYNAFPHLIPHTNPTKITDRSLLKQQVAKNCNCGRYCWRRGQVWETIIPRMRQIMKDAVRMHLAQPHHGVFLEYSGLHLDKERDYFTVDPNTFLPLIPDVAIHFRCSDNLFGGMGLLSLKTMTDRIPKDAKYIYMFSEYGGRLIGKPLEFTSADIIKAVWQDLSRAFPNAIVISKRGMNVFTTSSIFASANVTICSPSSFCFYPAMSRDKLTYFIAGDGQYVDSDTEIHPNFHFVKGPNLYYHNFSQTTTVPDIINTLRIGFNV